jgi:hypothetical protein
MIGEPREWRCMSSSRVTKVEGDDITIERHLLYTEWTPRGRGSVYDCRFWATLDRTVAPPIAGAGLSVNDLVVEDATYPLAGTEVPCKKISFVFKTANGKSRVEWVSAAHGTLASKSVSPDVEEMDFVIAGYGTKDGCTWGRTEDEILRDLDARQD